MSTPETLTRAQILRRAAWRPVVARINSTPGHYLTPKTCRYWGNLWHGNPVAGPMSPDLYFVESASLDGEPRYYQVKRVGPDGIVYTVSDYPHHETAADALAAARFIAGVTL